MSQNPRQRRWSFRDLPQTLAELPEDFGAEGIDEENNHSDDNSVDRSGSTLPPSSEGEEEQHEQMRTSCEVSIPKLVISVEPVHPPEQESLPPIRSARLPRETPRPLELSLEKKVQQVLARAALRDIPDAPSKRGHYSTDLRFPSSRPSPPSPCQMASFIEWRTPDRLYRRRSPLHTNGSLSARQRPQWAHATTAGHSKKQSPTSFDNFELVHSAIEEFDDQINGCASEILLSDWLKAYKRERECFHSIAVFARVKLREITERTANMGHRHHRLKTCVAIDLFAKLCDSLPSSELRSCCTLLRNEIVLAAFEGELPKMDMRLDDLLHLRAFFDLYPPLLKTVEDLRDKAADAKVSQKEVIDFERRKIYVVNHQTRKYEHQLLTVVFCMWRDTVQTHRRGCAKLNVFVDTLLKRRREKDDRAMLRRCWRQWCVWKSSKLQKKKRQSLMELGDTCTRAKLLEAKVSAELAAVYEEKAQLALIVSQAKTRNKNLRLRQAHLSKSLRNMGGAATSGSKLAASLKRLMPVTLHAMYIDQITRLSKHRHFEASTLEENYQVVKPDRVQPGTKIDANSERQVTLLEQEILSRALSLIGREGDDASTPQTLQQLLNSRDEMNVLIPALQTTSEVRDALTFANEQSLLDLSIALLSNVLPTRHFALPETVATNIKIIKTHESIEPTENNLKIASALTGDVEVPEDCASTLQSAMKSLSRALQRSQERQLQPQLVDTAIFGKACETLARRLNDPTDLNKGSGASKLDSKKRLALLLQREKGFSAASTSERTKVHKKLKANQRRLRRIFRTYAGLSAEGSLAAMSSQEFWKFLRDCRIPDSSLPSHEVAAMFAVVAQMQEDIERVESGASADAVEQEDSIEKDYMQNELDFEQWLTLLIMIAPRKHGQIARKAPIAPTAESSVSDETAAASATAPERPLSKSFDMLLNQQVLCWASTDESWCEFLAQISTKPIQSIFQKHRAFLQQLFSFFSNAAGSLSHLDFQEFQTLLQTLKLGEMGLSVADARVIFAKVGAVVVDDSDLDGKELAYPDFLQCIAALACYYVPTRSPFVPLQEKVRRFITEVLKVRYTGK